ncbi:MAG: collagenase [Fibrobacteres bacterium]|nr:collagenase [Fibrobacterota bacterium]
MMKKHSRKACVLALTAFLAMGRVLAEDVEEINCGTPDNAPALAKSADIPKVTKVYSGKLKAMVIRIGFSDAPYSVDTATINKTNATINTLYRSMSRNTFEWDWRTYDKILIAPGTAADYGANFNSLQSWITTQITAAALKRGTDYDVYVASFPQIAVGWAGLSNLRDADWINGSYSAGVTGHELGHSLGLPHAHSIEAGTDMFGTPGTTTQTNEYGNPYDIMGRGGSTGHFNVLYKWRIGWEDSAEIKEVKASGTYRIYAQDNAVHKGRTIGIRVPSGNINYAYWFEYRTISTTARNGAAVMFQGFRTSTNLDSWYLDTTPGSRTSGDESDGVLAVGKQFQDKYGEATFKTLAINTGTWTEEGWVDVQVTIPGTTPVSLIARNNGIRLFRASEVPAFNIMGRSIAGLSSMQTLAVKTENGATRLILNAR